jgi:formylglycine-generating enzyme required for sulfatase activity
MKTFLQFLFAPAAFGAEPFTNSIGVKLIPVAPGSFMMGQDGPASDYHIAKHPEKYDDADWHEEPAHRVKITHRFYMAAT